MATVVITGANQGIGLEFARQYAQAGWSVVACCREPARATALEELARATGHVEIAALDLTDHASIGRLAGAIAPRPVDLLVNNAGIMGALPFAGNLHRRHFGSIDYELWDQMLRTNTLGTVRVTEALVELVAASVQKKIVSLSSTTGSIAESRRQALAYTTSKAALNKAMTLIADQLRPRGVVAALLCPGYVKTRMNVGGATVEIPDSVAGMRRLIDAMTFADSGTFRRFDGATIAW